LAIVHLLKVLCGIGAWEGRKASTSRHRRIEWGKTMLGWRFPPRSTFSVVTLAGEREIFIGPKNYEWQENARRREIGQVICKDQELQMLRRRRMTLRFHELSPDVREAKSICARHGFVPEDFEFAVANALNPGRAAVDMVTVERVVGGQLQKYKGGAGAATWLAAFEADLASDWFGAPLAD
jgi:hypothetical protein